MAREAPIVVGTSLLDSSGKIKVPTSIKGLAQYGVANGAVPGTIEGLAQWYANQQAGAMPNATGSPVAPVAPSAPATSRINGVNGAGVAGNPLAGLAPMQGAISKRAANTAAKNAGVSPDAFAAALKLAQRAMGGFNGSAYDIAAGNARSQAQTSRRQTRRQGARAEADDAVLYGHLKNYVRGISKANNRANTSIIKTSKAGFDAAKAVIDKEYGRTANTTQGILNSRGLANDMGPANNSRKFAQSQLASDAATTLANQRSTRRGSNSILRQRMADAVITGTGKIADQKNNVNNALSGIASALSNQLAGINTQRATAANAYNTSVRSQALGLMSSQAANDPNSPANRLKLAQSAQALANARRIMSGLNNPGAATSTKLAPYEKGLSDIQTATAGHPKEAATLTNMFNQIVNGQGKFANTNLNSYGTTNSAMNSILAEVQKELQGSTGQGFNPVTDQQIILQALMNFLGK